MTILVDAAPIVAAADRTAQRLRPAVQHLLREARRRGEALVVPAPVTAEIDFLLGQRVGEAARRAFLDDLAARRFVVECLRPSEYATAAELDRRYADLRLGLADASLVALAERFATTSLLTFDERHFRAVKPLQGGCFTLLPADA